MTTIVIASNIPEGEFPGAYSFDLDSLAATPTYDGSGNMVTLTYGPDALGRSIRQTSTWTGGVWVGDSGWELI